MLDLLEQRGCASYRRVTLHGRMIVNRTSPSMSAPSTSTGPPPSHADRRLHQVLQARVLGARLARGSAARSRRSLRGRSRTGTRTSSSSRSATSWSRSRWRPRLSASLGVLAGVPTGARCSCGSGRQPQHREPRGRALPQDAARQPAAEARDRAAAQVVRRALAREPRGAVVGIDATILPRGAGARALRRARVIDGRWPARARSSRVPLADPPRARASRSRSCCTRRRCSR